MSGGRCGHHLSILSIAFARVILSSPRPVVPVALGPAFGSLRNTWNAQNARHERRGTDCGLRPTGIRGWDGARLLEGTGPSGSISTSQSLYSEPRLGPLHVNSSTNRWRTLCTRGGRGLPGEGRGSPPARPPLRGRKRTGTDDADHTRSGRLSDVFSVADSSQLGNGSARAPTKDVPSCDKRWVGARNL
jgi:hypothetical protein